MKKSSRFRLNPNLLFARIQVLLRPWQAVLDKNLVLGGTRKLQFFSKFAGSAASHNPEPTNVTLVPLSHLKSGLDRERAESGRRTGARGA
jgi:hypothetical protein